MMNTSNGSRTDVPDTTMSLAQVQVQANGAGNNDVVQMLLNQLMRNPQSAANMQSLSSNPLASRLLGNLGGQSNVGGQTNQSNLGSQTNLFGQNHPLSAQLLQQLGLCAPALNQSVNMQPFAIPQPPQMSGIAQQVSMADSSSMGATATSMQCQPLTCESKPSQPTPDSKNEENEGPDKNNHDFTLVPCRARGMPMDHNFKNAYFVIPEDIQHGAHLVCSYPRCRNGGVKFRYCSTCKTPVAKRNFRNRHNHEDHLRNGGGEGESSSKQASLGRTAAQAQKGEKNQSQPKPQRPEKAQKRNNTENPGASRSAELVSGSIDTSNSKTGSVVSQEVTAKNSDLAASGENHQTTVEDGRRKAWTRLLARRPEDDDGAAMSAWLMEVLAVSDLAKPVSDKIGTNFSVESSGKRGSSDSSSAMTKSSSSMAESNTESIYSSVESSYNDGSSSETLASDHDYRDARNLISRKKGRKSKAARGAEGRERKRSSEHVDAQEKQKKQKTDGSS